MSTTTINDLISLAKETLGIVSTATAKDNSLEMIINAGIREVVYAGNYAFDEQTRKLLANAGVVCRKYVAPEEAPAQ